jgi:hypothetical protein
MIVMVTKNLFVRLKVLLSISWKMPQSGGQNLISWKNDFQSHEKNDFRSHEIWDPKHQSSFSSLILSQSYFTYGISIYGILVLKNKS